MTRAQIASARHHIEQRDGVRASGDSDQDPFGVGPDPPQSGLHLLNNDFRVLNGAAHRTHQVTEIARISYLTPSFIQAVG